MCLSLDQMENDDLYIHHIKDFDVDLWNMEHQTMLTFYFSAMIYLSFKLITNDTKKHQTNYPKLFSEWTSSYFLRFVPETIMQILTNMQNNTLLVMDFLYRRAVLYICVRILTLYARILRAKYMVQACWCTSEHLWRRCISTEKNKGIRRN